MRFATPAALLLRLALAGCTRRPGTKASPQSPPPRGTIGLSVLTLTNPFFKVIAGNRASTAWALFSAARLQADFPSLAGLIALGAVLATGSSATRPGASRPPLSG